MLNIPFSALIPSGISMGSAFGHDIVQMIIHAGVMVKFVMLILLLFSVISWAIIFVKFRLIGKARRETERFLDLFWEEKEFKKIYAECDELVFSPLARLFSAGYAEFNRIRRIQSSTGYREDENPAEI